MTLTDSPFANLLHTNYVPSDAEVLQIRSLLMYPADELARIDAQIEAMEIALGQLKEQRAALKGPIDAHLALISPMRRIPHDVLLEIFFSCLPTEHNALIDPAKAPLVLGRICRHWRDVAYSAPMLWSSIHIPSPHYLNTPPNILSRFERIVKAWLERSAPCPLSISFFDEDHYEYLLEEHPLIMQLLPVSRRLRHLELTAEVNFLLPLLRLGSADFPLLKRLWIQSFGDRLDPPNVFQAPTLEDVALRINMPVDPPALPFQWSQLTRLCLECYPVWTDGSSKGGLDFQAAFGMLRMCPNLVHCEMQVTEGSVWPDVTVGMPPIILPYLNTLVFNQYAVQNWILDVPNLRFLRIGSALDNPSNSPQNRFLSADINPNLLASSDSLRALLRSIPTISHLRLSGFIQLDDLGVFGPPDSLCPELTHFTIISPPAKFSDAAALTLVKARMAMPTPLKQFCVRFDRPMEVDVMPELQSFIEDGLEVALEYPRPQWKFRAQDGLHRVAA
ncbi:Hexose carrier protein [Mycena sanguinolenta]|uniref:Hexose carrier protein n=1 Tax=Mycena sanguinolenta TaxID=230812 RepID=A0A8H6XXS0_9AGAR|nr:Hexose carrier protein [Mycena sanguinolenta]